MVHTASSTFSASWRAFLFTLRSSRAAAIFLRAAASAFAAVRICERETVVVSLRRRSVLSSTVSAVAPTAGWEVPDEASRLSLVAGSAARTPMVTADSVATTASGAETRTERGIRDGRGVVAGASRLWRC